MSYVVKGIFGFALLLITSWSLSLLKVISFEHDLSVWLWRLALSKFHENFMPASDAHRISDFLGGLNCFTQSLFIFVSMIRIKEWWTSKQRRDRIIVIFASFAVCWAIPLGWKGGPNLFPYKSFVYAWFSFLFFGYVVLIMSGTHLINKLKCFRSFHKLFRRVHTCRVHTFSMYTTIASALALASSIPFYLISDQQQPLKLSMYAFLMSSYFGLLLRDLGEHFKFTIKHKMMRDKDVHKLNFYDETLYSLFHNAGLRRPRSASAWYALYLDCFRVAIVFGLIIYKLSSTFLVERPTTSCSPPFVMTTQAECVISFFQCQW